MNKQVSYAYQHLSRTETLGKCIHGSMYLCPALLIALGKFEYYGSGGCQIGDSIDSHNTTSGNEEDEDLSRETVGGKSLEVADAECPYRI